MNISSFFCILAGCALITFSTEACGIRSACYSTSLEAKNGKDGKDGKDGEHGGRGGKGGHGGRGGQGGNGGDGGGAD